MYGLNDFNDLYTAVADSNQAHVIVEIGGDVFTRKEGNNSADVNANYLYDIYTTGGRAFVSMGEASTKKELFSRPNWDSTNYPSASSASAYDATILDEIIKPAFFIIDRLRANHQVNSRIKNYIGLPWDEVTKK